MLPNTAKPKYLKFFFVVAEFVCLTFLHCMPSNVSLLTSGMILAGMAC